MNDRQPTRPPSTMLMGEPGSGKTWSIVTFAKANVDVFLLALDSTSVNAAWSAMDHYGLDPSRLHTRYVPAAAVGFDTLEARASMLNQTTYKTLTELKGGLMREKTDQLKEMYRGILDFKCDCCNKSWGPVKSWGDDRAFVLDSLSTLNTLTRQNFMGLKPALAPGEWGVIMSEEDDLLGALCGQLNCYFVLLAHQAREPDEVSGGNKISPNALGSKLGPTLGRHFSEHLTAKRANGKFIWSNDEPNSTVFQRALPPGKQLEPSFVPLVQLYENIRLSPNPTQNTLVTTLADQQQSVEAMSTSAAQHKK